MSYSINTVDGLLLLELGSIYSNNYSNASTVPFEPLEQGRFSTDSKLATPFQFTLTAFWGVNKLVAQQILEILDNLQRSTQLLIVDGYFTQYQPVTLVSYTQPVDVTNTQLVVNLTFSQVRQTTAQYSTAKYKNPLYKEQKQLGLEQGTAKDSSLLNKFFGTVG
jgi:hypothetical protein